MMDIKAPDDLYPLAQLMEQSRILGQTARKDSSEFEFVRSVRLSLSKWNDEDLRNCRPLSFLQELFFPALMYLISRRKKIVVLI